MARFTEAVFDLHADFEEMTGTSSYARYFEDEAF
jgi:hypothetical protein